MTRIWIGFSVVIALAARPAGGHPLEYMPVILEFPDPPRLPAVPPYTCDAHLAHDCDDAPPCDRVPFDFPCKDRLP